MCKSSCHCCLHNSLKLYGRIQNSCLKMIIQLSWFRSVCVERTLKVSPFNRDVWKTFSEKIERKELSNKFKYCCNNHCGAQASLTKHLVCNEVYTIHPLCSGGRACVYAGIKLAFSTINLCLLYDTCSYLTYTLLTQGRRKLAIILPGEAPFEVLTCSHASGLFTSSLRLLRATSSVFFPIWAIQNV